MPPNTLPTDSAPEAPAPSRLESFSDGVIAVVITIMVLEFKLPQEPGPKAFITDVIPTLAVYLLSFTYTGIYWINHNHLVNRLKGVDAPILYANLLLLFCLSLLPFATSYVLSEKFNSFPLPFMRANSSSARSLATVAGAIASIRRRATPDEELTLGGES
jgi:uncharacterized membrane protein